MSRCSAPWYELNISAPDNIVSACCYYSGAKDTWQDEPADIRTYWNSTAMRTIRRINGDAPMPEPNGCSSCFFFQNRKEGANYFDFDLAMQNTDLSAAQRDNLRRAREDFKTGREELTSTPLRIYANFGFTCNLACTMCHQVPRREDNKRQVSAASVLAWREALESALDVTVIGGEPFALPEAVAFIRQFIADPAFDNVLLTICTNGTVHHKHIDTLRRKRKLSFAISLDSISEGYEAIRVNGKWDLVERNIQQILELKRTERPEWSLQTNALIQKTGIPLLPRFAAWHAEHGIVTSFYDFINSRGTEDAFFAENVLHNPQALDDMPDWEDHFREAIKIFEQAKLDVAASTLDHYRARVAEAVAAYAEKAGERGRIRSINDWEPLLAVDTADGVAAQFAYSTAPGATSSLYGRIDGIIGFTKTRLDDHVATSFIPISVTAVPAVLRARLRWRKLGKRRPAHVWLQAEPGHEIPTERRILPRPIAGADMEVVMTANLPNGLHRVRLVGMPVGEEETLMPDLIELDLAGGTLLKQEPTTVAVPPEPMVAEPEQSEVASLSQRVRGLGRSVLRKLLQT